MKKYIIIAFLFTTAPVVFAQVPIDSIKAIIKREVTNKRSKSIIVGIVDANGRQIVAEGYKSDQNHTLPDGNTIYEIGSITKVFTSLVLADMSIKHQLNLIDPISKFLPKTVKTPVRNGKEISLLSLSTHRSGMPRFPYNVDPKNLEQPYADYTVDKLYEYVSHFEPPFDIDTKWRYSNVAYGLLGNILTLKAKKDFETLITEEICKPLNLNNTVISLTAKQKSNLATAHAETGTAVGLTDLGAIGPGGSIRSTANDLLTFAEANLGLIKTNLSPAIELTHVLQAKKDGNDTYTTMGWTLVSDDGKNLLFKDGGMPGYCTFLGIDKKNRIGVVVLSNSNNSVSDIGRHILDNQHHVEPYKYPWALLDTIRTTYTTKGTDAAIASYHQLKASNNPSFAFNENQLNYLGVELRKAGKIKEALKFFTLNAQEYPNTTLVYESLGEIYKRNKNTKMAVENFEKAKKLDPENPHWAYILEQIKDAPND
ncbi:serine hydrolase [Flavobacterium aquidurense]|uniref:serine hydrolase n=1 Tax=Flavobacterium aquidurense TaxID=362413 RepID=UPI003756BFC5